MKKNFAAFSLIEVLMVIIIIGVLLGVAVPAYTNAVERSKASKAVNNLKALQSAQQHYFAAKETFTDQFGLLGPEVGADFNAMDASDTDWSYSVPAFTAATFTIRATRTGGAQNTKTISVDENDVWTWNYKNPLN